MRRILISFAAALLLSLGLQATDGPLTNAANLMVRTDENGYLLTSAATAGLVDGPLTAFGNVRVRTDENGYLRVAIATGGATAPSDATYITQTASSGLSAEQALSTLSSGIMRVATTTGAITALTDSAGIIANISNETGSGVLVFGTSPTIATPVTSGSTPAVANVGANSCGTDAATIAGNDNAGSITVGATGGTQCRITFTTTAANRWHCVANNETTANLLRTTYVDTTHVDVLGTMVAGDVLTYLCQRR